MSKNKLTILLFFSVCIIWGTTWFAMEVAVSTIPPLFATGMRFLIASTILIFLAKAFNQPLLFPRGKGHWFVVVSIFYFAIPFTLMITGEMFISSGLASIIFANMPIAVMMASTIFLGLRLAAHQILGVFTAVASLCVILSNELDIGGEAIFIGSAALSIAVLIHAVMYVLVQKYCTEIQVITYNVMPSFLASLLLLIGSFLFEKPNILAFSPQSIMAVAYLGIFASVGGIVAYFKLGNISSPFVASLCFMIFPLIALSINAYISGNVISFQSLFMLIPLLIGVLFAKFDLRGKILNCNLNSQMKKKYFSLSEK
ncbi:Protein PagO [Vibrio parahaemolyticus]|uniref:DMT family transporter n=1 Tax=Vibrio parahaemolyticus TaxID=670 RepID=UPI003210895E